MIKLNNAKYIKSIILLLIKIIIVILSANNCKIR